MYTTQKKTIYELLRSMEHLHGTLGNTKDDSLRQQYLETCQQAAVSIGNVLEQENDERAAVLVKELEAYCESVYQLSLRDKISYKETADLDHAVSSVRKGVLRLPVKYRIVFLPYKAEMWDSLESIYLAAAADPDCEAVVCPIPYFSFDRLAGQWRPCYDGDRFPKNIPVVPYTKYPIDQIHPDMAYVHNPYDDHNYVTMIHPDYFSGKLKENVGKLIYVPYYVNAGVMSAGQLHLPVYRNMDYMVLQSQYMKETCAGQPYYDKILPLGSPKLDRVIRRCREGVPVPKAWRKTLEGKRVLMLNTSINDLLTSNEALLKKLRYFFRLIGEYDRLVVIWRPHPLLKATMRSMRPELLAEFEEIEQNFSKDGIGVLDTTPDIENTIAMSDGYIGSGASSVVNLFSAAGKPVFLFDNQIAEETTEEDRHVLRFISAAAADGKLYLDSLECSGIFEADMSDAALQNDRAAAPAGYNSRTENNPEKTEGRAAGILPIRLSGTVPDVPKWRRPFAYMTCTRMSSRDSDCEDIVCEANAGASADNAARDSGHDCLLMSPVFAGDVYAYDPASGRSRALGSRGREFDIRYWCCVPCGDSVFFLPDYMPRMMEYLPAKDQWMYHEEAFSALWKNAYWQEERPLVRGGVVFGDCLYLTTGTNNRVLKVKAGTGEYEILNLGGADNSCRDVDPELMTKEDSNGLQAVAKGADEEGLWFQNVNPQEEAYPLSAIILAPWDAFDAPSKWRVFAMPEDYYWKPSRNDRNGISGAGLDAGDRMVFVPYRAPHMVAIEKKTGAVRYLAEEFFKGSDEPGQGYQPDMNEVICMLHDFGDGRILVQKTRDKRLVLINTAGDTVSEWIPKLIDEDFRRLLQDDNAGFDRGDSRDYFCMRETVLFSLEHFLRHFAEGGYAGVHDAQMKALSTFAANLDGTCGEHVHQYMKHVLEQEYK